MDSMNANNTVLLVSIINIAQLIIGLWLDIMNVDTFADNEDVVCSVNCWLENQCQKLFYNKTKALGRHWTKWILVH